jgi:hypothetical protein
MYIFKDLNGNWRLRFRGEEWLLPARTVQSALYYVGQHLDKVAPAPRAGGKIKVGA